MIAVIAVVVHESMFGNTRRIAEAVAEGLGGRAVPVADAVTDTVAGADLVVLGAPTHVWGLSRPSTRKGAADQAAKSGGRLRLEPGAGGPGMREWLDREAGAITLAAVFDTRLDSPRMLTGAAGRKIVRALRRRSVRIERPVASFVVSKQGELVDGELERARAWGAALAADVASTA